MPFQLAASKTVTPGGTRTSRSEGANLSLTRPVPSWVAPSPPAGGTIRPSRRSASRSIRGCSSPLESLVIATRLLVLRPPPRAASAACLARNSAIQLPPHWSLPSSRSAALTASMICGVRASMMADVRPLVIAIGKKVELIACRPGMPNETLDAPTVMLTPNSSRIRCIVS